MNDDTQLRWITRNRSRPEKAKAAGQVIAGLATDKWAADFERLEEIGAQIAALADERFCNHCRVAGLDRGVLLIAVNEAALVSEMRLRWQGPLRRALTSGSMRPGINKIVFVFGHAGAATEG